MLEKVSKSWQFTMKHAWQTIIRRILDKLLFLARTVETLPHQTLTGKLTGFYKL